jgi:hypothetical protein
VYTIFLVAMEFKCASDTLVYMTSVCETRARLVGQERYLEIISRRTRIYDYKQWKLLEKRDDTDLKKALESSLIRSSSTPLA